MVQLKITAILRLFQSEVKDLFSFLCQRYESSWRNEGQDLFGKPSKNKWRIELIHKKSK